MEGAGNTVQDPAGPGGRGEDRDGGGLRWGRQLYAGCMGNGGAKTRHSLTITSLPHPHVTRALAFLSGFFICGINPDLRDIKLFWAGQKS